MNRKRWGNAYQGTLVQELSDLHEATIPDDGIGELSGDSLQDHTCIGASGNVKVVFRNLERHLIREIEGADYILGCVAWLTSEPILTALARKRSVQIIVQKEDFLRPDLEPSNDWRRRLRRLYDALPAGVDRYGFPGPVGGMSYCGDPSIEAVRCVGNHNRYKAPAFPRCHHKFVLFCGDNPSPDEPCFAPYAVWTGSFNFTKNAGNSFENGLLITDPNIVSAYFREYAQIAALSEPLDWESDWVAPQWRIGS